MHDNVDRETMNDRSACTSVGRESSALLTEAISRIIETIGVRASSDNDLMCDVGRLIGREKDFMGGETVLTGSTNGLITGEKHFTVGETARLRRENHVSASENDLTNGANGHADDENDRAAGETGHADGENNLVNGENGRAGDETARVNDETARVNGETGGTDDENGRTDDETPLHCDVVIVVEDLNVERWGEVDGATKLNLQGFVASLRQGYACGWDGVETTVVGADVAGAVVDGIGGDACAPADASFAFGWAAAAAAFGLRT